jgi:hypothetical protein
MTTGHTSSFAFLAPYGPLYRQLATVAESALALDPRLALLKLRQLAEAFAQALASETSWVPLRSAPSGSVVAARGASISSPRFGNRNVSSPGFMPDANSDLERGDR